MATRTLKATAVTSMSALALAAMSTTAQADGPELYGVIDVGLEAYSADDGIPAGFYVFPGLNSIEDPGAEDPAQSDAKDMELSNGFTSRLGVRGGEDLTDDLRAAYNIELQMDVLADGRNNTETRVGWVGLEGDWGRTRVGTQWMPLFEFAAWNVHRNEVHGFGTYYYTTEVLRDSLTYGFRQSSAVSYQYGGAYGHSDPFAFNITAGIGEGEDNESGVSSIQVAGQYSFNNAISVNAVVLQEIVDVDDGINDDEATLVNVGARWTVMPDLELGVNYMLVDDGSDDDSDRDSISVAAFYNFGQGWDGNLALSTASSDDDAVADIDLNLHGQVRYAFTDRTNARLEFEYVDFDDTPGGDSGSETLGMVALQHSF